MNYKLIRFIFFFVILASQASAFNPSQFSTQPIAEKEIDGAGIKLLYNTDQCLGLCEAWLELDLTFLPRDFTATNKQEGDFKVEFVKEKEQHAGLLDWGIELYEARQENKPVYCEQEKFYNLDLPDLNVQAATCQDLGETCIEDKGKCKCTYTQIQQCGTERSLTWVKTEENLFGKTLAKGDVYRVRVWGKKKPDLKNNVDWVPTILGQDIAEWAWWSSDWEAKVDVNYLNLPFQVTAGQSIMLEDLNLAILQSSCGDLNDVRVVNNTTNTELKRKIWGATDAIDGNIMFIADTTLSAGDHNNEFSIYSKNTNCPTTYAVEDVNYSTAHDDFEDNDYTNNPKWVSYDGAGALPVVDAGVVKEGAKSLHWTLAAGTWRYMRTYTSLHTSLDENFLDSWTWVQMSDVTDQFEYSLSRAGNVKTNFVISGDVILGQHNGGPANFVTVPADATWYKLRTVLDVNRAKVSYFLYSAADVLLEAHTNLVPVNTGAVNQINLSPFDTGGGLDVYVDFCGYDNNAHVAPNYTITTLKEDKVTFFKPTEDAYYNTRDLNIVFNITGSCAVYDVNIIEEITGHADADINVGFTLPKDVNYSRVHTLRDLEGDHKINVQLDCATTTQKEADVNVALDLNAPTIVGYGFDVNKLGFQDGVDANVYLQCQDSFSGTLTYHLVLNDTNRIDGDFANNSKQVQGVIVDRSVNDLNVWCEDVAGNYATDSNSESLYLINFVLINEETGAHFNLDDINGLVMVAPDKNHSYNFKTTGQNQVSYLSTTQDTLRLEMLYQDADTGLQETRIRYFGTGVVDTNYMRICVVDRYPMPKPTFFQHFLLSSRERKATIRNPFINCYVTADNTKFAYETNYIILVELIQKQYELTVWNNDGAQITLGLIDGSVESTINIDALEYGITEYNLSVTDDFLGISKPAGYTDTIKIYYHNPLENNKRIDLTIYDGTAPIWTYTETANPNDVNLLFDYATLSINNDMLKIEVERTLLNDSKETTTQYFTLAGATGILSPELAVIIAFIIVVFSLTFVAYRFAMGWFGIIACMIGIAILTMATPVWYVVFSQATLAIIIIYIVLIYRSETAAVT
jgi:hypothetical protein